MSSDELKVFLSNKNIKGEKEEKQNKSYGYQGLTFGDFIGEVYFKQPVGRVERLIVKSLALHLSQKTNSSARSVNAELRRFLDIRSLEGMTMGHFEKAVEFLAARTPD